MFQVVEESGGVELAPLMPNVVPEEMEDMLADVEDNEEDQQPDALDDTAPQQQPMVKQHKKKHKKTRADVLVVAGEFQKPRNKPSHQSRSVDSSATATGATSNPVSTAHDVAPAPSTSLWSSVDVSLGRSIGRAHSQSLSCESDAGEFDDDSLIDSDFDIQAAVASEDRYRRRYGPSSDSDVPLSPDRKRLRYHRPPPLKPGAVDPSITAKASYDSHHSSLQLPVSDL